MHTTPASVETTPPKRRSFMRRAFRKLFLWSAIFLGLVLLTSVIIAAFFEKQVGERLLTEINKQLNSELEVQDFDLSLLSGFPNASANLRNVTLNDALDGVLLEAENLSFRFGLFSLFGSNIKIGSVVIQNGALFIRTTRRGISNYDIVKKDPEAKPANAEDQELSLSIKEAELENVEVIYIDERVKQEMKIHVKQAIASGEFSSTQFSLSSFAEMESEFVELQDGRYFVGKKLVYDARLKMDFANGRYEFEDVSVGVETNTFKVNGFIESKGKNTDFDLKLTSNENNLKTMLSLFPEKYQAYFNDFKSKGTFLFDSSIVGRLNEKEIPSIRLNFSLKNGRISSPKLGNAIKDVHFTAKFFNGKEPSNKKAVFEITNFKGYFNRELFESKLKISNLEDPRIDFTLDGVLPLGAIYGLFNNPAITDGDGEIEFKNLGIKGRYKDMTSPSRIGRVKTSGVIEFDDAELTMNKQKIIVDKGLLQIKDNSVIVNKIKLEGAGSEIYLDGKFTNILPVIFADSTNSKKAELRFQATLEAPKLDIDRLVKLTEVPVEKNEFTPKGIIPVDSFNVVQIHRRQEIAKFLKGTFQAKIDQFNYNKIDGRDFSGSLQFDNNEMTIKGNAKGMEGNLNVDGKVFFEDKPYLQGKLICKDINVNEFFRQAENFGQQVIQYKHVRGNMNARFVVDAFWDRDGTFLDDELNVFGDVKINDGELVNYRMLYDFGNYIKLKDLQHIKFTNLRNWMEIDKGKIYMPAMFVQSNAANMTVSGKHDFKNRFEYNIKVNAGQILFSKFKKYNPDKQPQKAKKKGWFNLYYRIYGQHTDYKYKSDKRRVKRNFKSSENRKKRIQNVIEKAFGGTDNFDEPNDWKDENEIPELETEIEDDDPDFLDEFEIEEQEDDNNTPSGSGSSKPNKPKPKPKVEEIPELDEGDDDEFLDFEIKQDTTKKKKNI